MVLTFINLIFPIFLTVNTAYSHQYKRLFVTLKVFKFIKVFKFYIEKIGDTFAVHLTKNKAILIPTNKLLGFKKSVKPLKDYHIVRVKSLIIMGKNGNGAELAFLASSVSIINEILLRVINEYKPYLKAKNSISVVEGEDVFEIFINFTIAFNLLMIVISVIKILGEKIIYEIRKWGQQN